MNHKFKALGMAFVAVLAMSAVVASAAQANFNSAAYPATITGVQIATDMITGAEQPKHQFTTKAGTIQCNVAEFMGDLTETQTSLVLAPTYKECTLAGLAVTVAVNGCTYKFHTPETTSANTVDVKTDVVCPGGAAIEVTSKLNSCVVKVGAQTNLVGIETHNEATDVKATIDVKNIAYSLAGTCPGKPAAGNYNDGEYKGVATLSGNKGTVKVT